MSLRDVQPVIVTGLMPEVRRRGTAMLRSLRPGELALPTACGEWSVHDVALHILGGLLANVSRRRDGHPGNFDAFRPAAVSPDPYRSLVATLDAWNETWVLAGRRVSASLVADLIDLAGEHLETFFAGIDLMAMGNSIGWAGPGPAPVWLDVAREYTEIWTHFAQIREAVGQPLEDDPALFAPVIHAFMHAAPHALRDVDRPVGTTLAIEITGEAGGRWSVVRAAAGWRLWEGTSDDAAAQVRLRDQHLWRLATKGIADEEASALAAIEGDDVLGSALLRIVAILG